MISRDEENREPVESPAMEGMQSPFCAELRSKRYYFLQQMPTETGHLRDGSGRCWCRRTMQAFGPDGEMARPEDCAPGRQCYKSLL